MAVQKAKPKQDKFVDPLYSRNSGNPPLPSTSMPARTWGAGDPNYVQGMIASGKSKPVKRK